MRRSSFAAVGSSSRVGALSVERGDPAEKAVLCCLACEIRSEPSLNACVKNQGDRRSYAEAESPRRFE
jgi:hypothetical protein